MARPRAQTATNKAKMISSEIAGSLNGLVADCDNHDCEFNHVKMKKCLVPSRMAYDKGKCLGFEQRDK